MNADCILFGKLPAHGDFVSRGIAPQDRDRLDRDISASLGRAMERFTDGFEDRFLTAPPWRGVWPDDLGHLGGALAPSIDQAGRIYPVLLARQSNSMTAAGQYAAACEALLFEAIPARWSADELYAAAAALPEPAAESDAAPGWWLDGGDSLPSPTPRLDGAMPLELLSEMIAVTEQIG